MDGTSPYVYFGVWHDVFTTACLDEFIGVFRSEIKFKCTLKFCSVATQSCTCHFLLKYQEYVSID